MDDDTRFRLLRALEHDPEVSQRDLAKILGLSLGKVNYCLRALVEKGLIKADNFRKSKQKHRYLYQLTPAGLADKARITHAFLQRKLAEHAALTAEIEALRNEVEKQGHGSDGSREIPTSNPRPINTSGNRT